MTELETALQQLTAKAEPEPAPMTVRKRITKRVVRDKDNRIKEVLETAEYLPDRPGA